MVIALKPPKNVMLRFLALVALFGFIGCAFCYSSGFVGGVFCYGLGFVGGAFGHVSAGSVAFFYSCRRLSVVSPCFCHDQIGSPRLVGGFLGSA